MIFEKKSLLLYCFTWPNFNTWLPLISSWDNGKYVHCNSLLTRLRRNFEINLIFLIKSFSLHTQKVMTKDKSLNILRTNIIFKGLSLKQIEGVTGHSLVQNDFLFFVGFFCVYQCEGVFFHGQKSNVAQNLNTSRVFNQMLT